MEDLLVTTRHVEDTLRAAGHRVTRPRMTIWAVLRDAGWQHATAEEITARAKVVNPSINRASVYRALTLFEELGLARQTRLVDESASRWEPAHTDEDFHMVCRSCGTVDHHRGSIVAGIRAHLGEHHGFAVDQVELTVTGFCGRCGGRAPEAKLE